MNLRPGVRRYVLLGTVALILLLAWKLLWGALDQLPRSRTVGQVAETVVQIASGLSSLLVALTATSSWRRWRRPVRLGWLVSLVLTAGFSSLVWGPPMLVVGLILAALAFLAARGIIWLLQAGGA